MLHRILWMVALAGLCSCSAQDPINLNNRTGLEGKDVRSNANSSTGDDKYGAPDLPAELKRIESEFDLIVRPVYEAACANCHSGDSEEPFHEAYLWLNNITNHCVEGEAFGCIRKRLAFESMETELTMPPPYDPASQDAITAEDRDAVLAWIDDATETLKKIAEQGNGEDGADAIPVIGPGEFGGGIPLVDSNLPTAKVMVGEALGKVFSATLGANEASFVDPDFGHKDLYTGRDGYDVLLLAEIDIPNQNYIRAIRERVNRVCTNIALREIRAAQEGDVTDNILVFRDGLPTAPDVSKFMSHMFRANPAPGTLHAGAEELADGIQAWRDEAESARTRDLYQHLCIAVSTMPRTFMR